MQNAQELKETLIGQHIIKTDQVKLVANISDVMIMPQAYCTLYTAMLNEGGEINVRHIYTCTGV